MEKVNFQNWVLAIFFVKGPAAEATDVPQT
jgi:hypothetical protein